MVQCLVLAPPHRFSLCLCVLELNLERRDGNAVMTSSPHPTPGPTPLPAGPLGSCGGLICPKSLAPLGK